MSENGHTPDELERDEDFKEDYYRDQAPANFNLAHLSLSKTMINFLGSDPVLQDFKPLADQIMATNYLDERNIRIYKNIFDSMILERSMRGGLTRQSMKNWIPQDSIFINS